MKIQKENASENVCLRDWLVERNVEIISIVKINFAKYWKDGKRLKEGPA